METAIIVLLCVILWMSIINGCEIDTLRDRLNAMAEKGDVINDVFEPSKNGSLGRGFFSVTHKGKMLHSVEIRMVAMKFTPLANVDKAANEYKMYTYLNAINNTDVERYAIPAVYYYGMWANYVLLAITLLDSQFNVRAKNHALNEVDILIVFTEFVKTLKYIHSRGVLHRDIKLDNIMFRRNQGFIIDYNVASTMYQRRDRMTSAQVDESFCSKYDWKDFLFSMCDFLGIQLNWFEMGLNPQKDAREVMQHIGEIKSVGMKRIFFKMANYAFENELQERIYHVKPQFTFYDHLHQIIEKEIRKFALPTPIWVSWLKGEEKDKAEVELANRANISSIGDQFEGDNVSYSKVDFDYFGELRSLITTNQKRAGENKKDRDGSRP